MQPRQHELQHGTRRLSRLVQGQSAGRRPGRGMAAAAMLAVRQRMVASGRGPQCQGHARAYTPKRGSGSIASAAARASKPAAVPGQAGGWSPRPEMDHVPCTLFKAAKNSNPNATTAKPVVLLRKGYLRLANCAKTPRHFLTQSLYKLCRTRLRRPLFKLTRMI